MTSDQMKDDFEADRRKLPREEPTDRRTLWRASMLLKVKGIFIAVAVALLVCAVVYFFMN